MNNVQAPTDTAKASRMARALLDEGYDQQYVTNILQEKGYSEEQIAIILHSGKTDVLERKQKRSRNLLLVAGFLWIIGIATYSITDHTVTHTDPVTGETVTASQPGGLALRYFLSLALLSLAAVVYRIWLFIQAAKTEQQKPKVSPQPRTLNARTPARRR
jgi:hypothetical protein